MNQQPTKNERLERLLGYLNRDPENLNLLTDAATLAFTESQLELAAELIDRAAAVGPLPAPLVNLQGLLALAKGEFGKAADLFEQSRTNGINTPALRFNLAWCSAMQGKFEQTANLLDQETLKVSSRAPALLIRALHHQERYKDALAQGEQLVLQFPDNKELMGALATLTMDMQRSDLALDFAKLAGADPEGKAALGLLTLGDHQTAPSLALFDEAISAQPNNPRAWVGKGLAFLSDGNLPQAIIALDKGATLFETHVGSWIASGWAHLIAGDNTKARESFERALALDPNFSESHGGLAALNILEGRQTEAERQTEIALRLDRNSFGAALAKILFLERAGNAKAAQKVRDLAFQTPIGPNGRTLAQELVTFGLAGKPATRSGGTPRRRA